MPLLLVKRISSKKVASVESDSYPSRSFPHQQQEQRQQEQAGSAIALFCPQFPPVWFLIRQQRYSSATSATLYISHYCLVCIIMVWVDQRQLGHMSHTDVNLFHLDQHFLVEMVEDKEECCYGKVCRC